MKFENLIQEIHRNDTNNQINETLSDIKKITKELLSMSYGKVKMTLNKASKSMIKIIKKQGVEEEILAIINKYLNTKYKSINQFAIKSINESINEGFKEWFDEVKGTGYASLNFFPALTMWIEIDKLIKGQDYSMKVLVTYFVIWIGIVSSKVALGKFTPKIKALGSKI